MIDATGNTLVHIDAHPDSGVPAEVPGFAQFRTPRTAEEIRILMQRNDVFITVSFNLAEMILHVNVSIGYAA